MNAKTNPTVLAVFGALAFVYFVMFPEDVQAITAPIAAVLELSHSPSPLIYGVIAVGILTWGIVKVWGRREPGR